MKAIFIPTRIVSLLLILFIGAPSVAHAQQTNTPPAQATAAPAVSQEQLDQLLAPIALYPDSLLAQILMASTYPLEIVQADRWVKQNTSLKDEALAAALEKQTWDPSVKSLVNFPSVLTMMNEKIDWTSKLGDAVLADQKAVMDTVQKLRAKAMETGNLKTTKEQTVTTEGTTIIIQSASPQVVYVPTYNPTVVYGTWWYPAYPPYYYYPPGYAYTTAAYSFAAGVAVGAAWGYAWGNCNWHGGDIDIDIDHNYNYNKNIDRSKYKNEYNKSGAGSGGKGDWQHDASHRKGAAYPNQATAQKYNRASTADASKARDSYRGRTDSPTQQPSRSGSSGASASNRASGGSSNNAFSGMDRGSSASQYSNRGQSSMSRSGYSGGGGRSMGGGGRGGGGGRR